MTEPSVPATPAPEPAGETTNVELLDWLLTCAEDNHYDEAVEAGRAELRRRLTQPTPVAGERGSVEEVMAYAWEFVTWCRGAPEGATFHRLALEDSRAGRALREVVARLARRPEIVVPEDVAAVTWEEGNWRVGVSGQMVGVEVAHAIRSTPAIALASARAARGGGG